MVAWIARGLLIAGGAVTSWFVAKDAPNFELVQMAVGLLLLTLVESVIAFWPSSRRKLNASARGLRVRRLGRARCVRNHLLCPPNNFSTASMTNVCGLRKQ